MINLALRLDTDIKHMGERSVVQFKANKWRLLVNLCADESITVRHLVPCHHFLLSVTYEIFSGRFFATISMAN